VDWNWEAILLYENNDRESLPIIKDFKKFQKNVPDFIIFDDSQSVPYQFDNIFLSVTPKMSR
jgi:hypothetical protein